MYVFCASISRFSFLFCFKKRKPDIGGFLFRVMNGQIFCWAKHASESEVKVFSLDGVHIYLHCVGAQIYCIHHSTSLTWFYLSLSPFPHSRGFHRWDIRLDKKSGWVWQIGTKMWDKAIAFHIELGIRDNMDLPPPCTGSFVWTSCKGRWESTGNWKAISVNLITPKAMDPVSL